MRVAQGKLFSLEGCSHRSPATARIHKQTGRLGPTRSAKETWPTRHPRTKDSPARPPDSGKATSNDHRAMHPRISCGGLTGSAVWMPLPGRATLSVNLREPSFMTPRQRTASVGDSTHFHNLPQQAQAYLPSPAHCGGALAAPLPGCKQSAQRHRRVDVRDRSRRAMTPSAAWGASPQSPAALRADTPRSFTQNSTTAIDAA